MTKIPAPKLHLPFLDALRAIAALYVLMHHAMLHYNVNPASQNAAEKSFYKLFFFGHYTVSLFIVISGFSLMLPVIKRNYELGSPVEFYKRRIKRILPPYYIALGISVVLVLFFIGGQTKTFWSNSLPMTVPNIFTHVFFVNDILKSHTYKINYSLWSIPVECRIYLFFPLLLLVRRRWGALPTLGLAVLVSVVLLGVMAGLKQFYHDVNLTTPGVNPYIILFTLGMLAADISFGTDERYQKLKQVRWGLLIVACTVVFVVFKAFARYIHLNEVAETEIADVLFGALSFCILTSCSLKNFKGGLARVLYRFLEWKPLVFIGTFSYSIYLIHAPLLQLLSVYVIRYLHLKRSASGLVLMLAGTSVIVIIAYGFFRLFEKPFMNSKKKVTETLAVPLGNEEAVAKV
ncbi:acyltransferase family protein [Mucilaginibacter terrae]|uniref:Peptidoglycan/LPS O-acetylase OafA/YrhL n=1 Tax=Mucilaginibacter terrae TaxID=1955052 RepID=A0ABU3H055_9SPHI|nr:acyltransferase [Mucilaginibacter terrae]MDT3405066.1 peptidoglycan/LPS O-acetylase OafA/YrhL [Mucilaginibacter terrae]